MRTRLIRIALLAAALLAAAAVVRTVARPAGDSDTWSGVVEATTWELSFERPGRVAAVPAREGQAVRKGALLAEQDVDGLQAELRQAQARLAAAKASLDNLRAGARSQEIDQARARLDSARAELAELRNGATAEEMAGARAGMEAARQRYQLVRRGARDEDVAAAAAQVRSARSTRDAAQRDFERFARLHREGAVPTQVLDQHRNRLDVARAALQSAEEGHRKLVGGALPEERAAAWQDYESRRAAYQRLADGTRIEQVERAQGNVGWWESQVALLEAGPRPDEVRVARQKVDEAAAAVDGLRVRMRDARLHAPADGIVELVSFEAGETAAPGVPVVTLADLARPWVDVYVAETEIGRFRVGGRAWVTVDSLPGRAFSGRVARVYDTAEFTPKQVQTKEQRVRLVFRVKVALDDTDGSLKPGMPADVRLAP